MNSPYDRYQDQRSEMEKERDFWRGLYWTAREMLRREMGKRISPTTGTRSRFTTKQVDLRILKEHSR